MRNCRKSDSKCTSRRQRYWQMMKRIRSIMFRSTTSWLRVYQLIHLIDIWDECCRHLPLVQISKLNSVSRLHGDHSIICETCCAIDWSPPSSDSNYLMLSSLLHSSSHCRHWLWRKNWYDELEYDNERCCVESSDGPVSMTVTNTKQKQPTTPNGYIAVVAV